MDRKVSRMKAKIRKMTWHQKLILMDWINAWYEDYKAEAKRDYEQYMEEQ